MIESMNMLWLDVVSRCLHVLAAAALLGGSIFSRFVLLPSAAELSDAEHEKLRAGVLSRWKRFVHGGIAVLLASGFYNFVRALPAHRGQEGYHAIIGVKILLAVTVFFLASVLVGRSSASAAMRQNARRWAGLIVLLGTAIVVISGYAKVALPGKVASASAPSE